MRYRLRRAAAPAQPLLPPEVQIREFLAVCSDYEDQQPSRLGEFYQAESCSVGWLAKKLEGKKPPLFLPIIPNQEQVPEREASTDCLAYASSSILGLKSQLFCPKMVFSGLMLS